jgi:hypothetical protein
MTRHRSFNALTVLAAAGMVLLLATLLGFRLVSRAGEPAAGSLAASAPPVAAEATLPAATPIVVGELPDPFCWGCSWNTDAALEFKVDLDLLAPLGTGASNAAVWFRDFAKGGSRREAEGRAAYADRLVELPYREVRGLPADDPLLLEAEPWVDQATLRFYPEVWPITGMDTGMPDLLMMLDLARSWVARGMATDDRGAAREDFRRAIRLGRLLRQDDVTIIQDLVAIACIGLGAQAFYDLAREEGDTATMLVATLVLADKNAMRQLTAQRVSDPALAALPVADGLSKEAMDEKRLEAYAARARNAPDRRFRMEALIALHAIRVEARDAGPAEHAEHAAAVLAELSEDEDELVAGLARRFRDSTMTGEQMNQMLENLAP